MNRRMDTIAVVLVIVGGAIGLLLPIATQFSRSADLWLRYVGICVAIAGGFVVVQKKQWENEPKTTGTLAPGNGIPREFTKLMDGYPPNTNFLRLGDALVVVARRLPYCVLQQDGENVVELQDGAGGVALTATFYSEYGEKICEINANRFEVTLPAGYTHVPSKHELVIKKDGEKVWSVSLPAPRVVRFDGDFHLKGGEPLNANRVFEYQERQLIAKGLPIDMPQPAISLDGHTLAMGGGGEPQIIDLDRVKADGAIRPSYPAIEVPDGEYNMGELPAVTKGVWYFGSNCKSCSKFIHIFSDESDGRRQNPFFGPGLFLATCPHCGGNNKFGTKDIASVQASEDWPR